MTDAAPEWRHSSPLALINLTFISECRIPVDDQEHAIEALSRDACHSNEIADITGALLFTGQHFVESLEGPTAKVNDLMARIELDPRHTDIVVIDRRRVTSRAFARWAMAYSGRSVFVARMAAAARCGNQVEVRRLLRLIREFGTGLPRLLL